MQGLEGAGSEVDIAAIRSDDSVEGSFDATFQGAATVG
jgi:hypothetical protein